MKFDKKFFIHTGAGIAAVVLLAFGISQCSEKQNMKNDFDKHVKNLSEQVDILNQRNKVINDSIGVLNDSLVVVNKELENCGKKKPVITKPVKKNKTTPVQTKPVEEKKQEVTVVINESEKKQDKSDVRVVNDDKSGSTNINIVGNSINDSKITVNTGGVVNNYYQNDMDTVTKRIKIIRNMTVTRNVKIRY